MYLNIHIVDNRNELHNVFPFIQLHHYLHDSFCHFLVSNVCDTKSSDNFAECSVCSQSACCSVCASVLVWAAAGSGSGLASVLAAQSGGLH